MRFDTTSIVEKDLAVISHNHFVFYVMETVKQYNNNAVDQIPNLISDYVRWVELKRIGLEEDMPKMSNGRKICILLYVSSSSKDFRAHNSALCCS